MDVHWLSLIRNEMVSRKTGERKTGGWWIWARSLGGRGGLKTRERIPFSGGMEMEVEPAAERRGIRGVLINGREAE